MFGYLRVQKSELLVREYEAYKSVYCGLCNQLGRDYSFLTRFILSYDCTFYAMLLMSLKRSCKSFKDGRCKFNPLKKCKFAADSADCYSKASALSVISSYYKLKDDITDSGFLKKIAACFLKPFFFRWHKKAAKNYPQIENTVSEMMAMQFNAEHCDNASIDSAAHPTAYMLANILSVEAENEADKRIYYEFGYHLGRWVYLIDAADDYEDDIKHNNFNPFLSMKQDNIFDYMTRVLNQSLARAYNAYNLIELTDFKGIFDNMMLYGFPSAQNTVMKKKTMEVKNDESV